MINSDAHYDSTLDSYGPGRMSEFLQEKNLVPNLIDVELAVATLMQVYDSCMSRHSALLIRAKCSISVSPLNPTGPSPG
jgi:hypothetical protein